MGEHLIEALVLQRSCKGNDLADTLHCKAPVHIAVFNRLPVGCLDAQAEVYGVGFSKLWNIVGNFALQ